MSEGVTETLETDFTMGVLALTLVTGTPATGLLMATTGVAGVTAATPTVVTGVAAEAEAGGGWLTGSGSLTTPVTVSTTCEKEIQSLDKSSFNEIYTALRLLNQAITVSTKQCDRLWSAADFFWTYLLHYS